MRRSVLRLAFKHLSAWRHWGDRLGSQSRQQPKEVQKNSDPCAARHTPPSWFQELEFQFFSPPHTGQIHSPLHHEEISGPRNATSAHPRLSTQCLTLVIVCSSGPAPRHLPCSSSQVEQYLPAAFSQLYKHSGHPLYTWNDARKKSSLFVCEQQLLHESATIPTTLL